MCGVTDEFSARLDNGRGQHPLASSIFFPSIRAARPKSEAEADGFFLAALRFPIKADQVCEKIFHPPSPDAFSLLFRETEFSTNLSINFIFSS